MNRLTKTLMVSALRTASIPRANFGIDKQFKDRDQGEEKIYIHEHEKSTLKKLLYKLQEQEDNMGDKTYQFTRRMKLVVKKYGINNVAFEAEVENLHRNL